MSVSGVPNVSRPLAPNTTGNIKDREAVGSEFQAIGKTVQTSATVVWAGDLFGIKTKTFSFVNQGANALAGAGNLIQASPDGVAWEDVGGASFNGLASGGVVASETFEDARRYWQVVLIASGGATTGDFYAHGNND